MEREELRHDQHAALLLIGHIRSAKRQQSSGESSTGAAKPIAEYDLRNEGVVSIGEGNAKTLYAGSILKRLLHNRIFYEIEFLFLVMVPHLSFFLLRFRIVGQLLHYRVARTRCG